MSLVVAVLGLGLLIFVHELGHFSVSLALRMRPRRFYIGFPPAIWKTKVRGIEYAVGAIPLGGFVTIPGMHRPAPADVDHQLGRVVEAAPGLGPQTERLRRAIEDGDMEAARVEHVRLAELVEERQLAPEIAASAEKGLTSLGDALGPDAYWRAPTWKRVAAIFAGPAANVVFALAILAVLFATSAGRVTTTVETVVEESPAAAMGLQPDDRIVAIGGTPVEANEISATIGDSEGKELLIQVVRDGETVELGPVAAEELDGRYRLGFVLAGEGLGPVAAIGESVRVTGLVTAEIVRSLGRVITGEGRDEIASPVGIVQGSSEAAKQGTDSYLWVLALISLSIALLNLLPLLPLDGGHILFALIEGVQGRSVRREVYERVSVVGIAVVMLLFFIGLTNDIGRLS